MGATWISERVTLTIIMTLLQIQALTGAKTKLVTGVEGQTFSFRCEYPRSRENSAKYFLKDDDGDDPLIRTDKHNQWVTDGRFSLYDNTSGAVFIIKVDELVQQDSGTYCCGVDVSLFSDYITFIKLNVAKVSAAVNPPQNLTRLMNLNPTFPKNLTVDKLHVPLFMTAVMCVAAMLFVCLFTLCLLWAVKHQRSVPRQNREISSDYETMMPGVRTEPERCCAPSAPDCADLSSLPPPPPDLCCHFTAKHRESAVSFGLGEYVDVDVPGHICQYEHLDCRWLEEHVYHSLHGSSSPKNGPLGVREQINCCDRMYTNMTV